MCGLNINLNPLTHGRFSIFQSTLTGDETNFFDFFFHRGIRNKSFARLIMFRYGLPNDIFITMQKTKGGGGGPISPLRMYVNILMINLVFKNFHARNLSNCALEANFFEKNKT